MCFIAGMNDLEERPAERHQQPFYTLADPTVAPKVEGFKRA